MKVWMAMIFVMVLASTAFAQVYPGVGAPVMQQPGIGMQQPYGMQQPALGMQQPYGMGMQQGMGTQMTPQDYQRMQQMLQLQCTTGTQQLQVAQQADALMKQRMLQDLQLQQQRATQLLNTQFQQQMLMYK